MRSCQGPAATSGICGADMIRRALDACDDSRLSISMNLVFASSVRMGEILGLAWCGVHISDAEIAEDNPFVVIAGNL